MQAVLDFFGPDPAHVPFGIEHKHKMSNCMVKNSNVCLKLGLVVSTLPKCV